MLFSSGGTGGTRKYPSGVGWPAETSKGSSGPWSGRRGPTGGQHGRLCWKGVRCSASRTRRPITGYPGPCALPSPTSATAQGTRRCRSPRPPASGGAGEGHAWRQWPNTQQAGPQTPDSERGGVEADQRPGASPGRPRPPDPEPPPPPPLPSAQQEDKRHPPLEEAAEATDARAAGVRQRRWARRWAQ